MSVAHADSPTEQLLRLALTPVEPSDTLAERLDVRLTELTAAAFDELADWELLTDALVAALGGRGLMNVDELRRGIESMPPAEYERASYYERWLYSVEAVLSDKGRVTAELRVPRPR